MTILSDDLTTTVKHVHNARKTSEIFEVIRITFGSGDWLEECVVQVGMAV